MQKYPYALTQQQIKITGQGQIEDTKKGLLHCIPWTTNVYL